MKAINLNRSLIATLFAFGLALAGTNAVAMTTDHDTNGNGAAADSSRAIADDVIGGKVGNLTLRDLNR